MEISSITDFIKNGIDDKITDFTKDNKCSRCGSCCGRLLPLSAKEIDKIKSYVKEHGIKPNKHFVPLAGKCIDFTCPFRDNVKKVCTIYEVRPEICKQFICNKEERAKSNRTKLLNNKRKIIDMWQAFYKYRRAL